MRPHCDTNAKNEGSMRGAPEPCYGGEEGVLSTDVTVAHLAKSNIGTYGTSATIPKWERFLNLILC